MNADRQIEIDRAYNVIDDERNCAMCLFPVEGEGSLENLAEKYGDDFSALMQSAEYYLIAEDGRYYALERDGQCFIGSSEGVFPVASGKLYEDPNREDLVATECGWKPV